MMAMVMYLCSTNSICIHFLYFQTKENLASLLIENEITIEFVDNFEDSAEYPVRKIKVSHEQFTSVYESYEHGTWRTDSTSKKLLQLRSTLWVNDVT